MHMHHKERWPFVPLNDKVLKHVFTHMQHFWQGKQDLLIFNSTAYLVADVWAIVTI